MRFVKIAVPLLMVSFLAALFFLPAYAARHHSHGDPKAQAVWLWSSVQELQNRGLPPANFTNGLPPGVWANHGFLVFSNGWASFAYHTVHETGDVGDIALLRTSEGIFYVSHYHFCCAEATFYSERQPKDIADFLEMFGAKHGWKRGADPATDGH